MQLVQTLSKSIAAPMNMPWARAFHFYRYLTGPAAAYTIVCFGMLALNRPSLLGHTVFDIINFITGSLVMMFMALALFVIGFIAKNRPSRPLTAVGQSLRANQLTNENIPFIVIPWITLAVVITFFVKMKILIPTLNPFYLDVAAHDLDKWLHFGTHPWEWLAPFTNIPDVTYILHRNYYVWFPAIYVTFFWQVATVKDPKLRLQFIMAFIATWAIVGTGMATAMSSVGPIFYNLIPDGNSTSYAVPLAYLQELHKTEPLLTLDIRDQLWNSYQGIVENRYVRGISAIPSMHVAASFVLVLLGWRKHWAVGTAYTIFGLMIMVASISLLWHYAIDGYISIIAVSIIWWVCGKLADKAIASDPVFSKDAEAA